MEKRNDKKKAYWKDIMEQYESSGLNQSEFCKANKLSFSKFKYYRYMFQQEAKKQSVELPSLVPVKLTQSEDSHSLQDSSSIELLLPNKVRMVLSPSDMTTSVASFVKELLSC